jgi:hypothetical protein
MKLTELRPCDACASPLGVTFFRLQVNHEVVDVGEVRKRHALDVMFPGGPAVAAALHGDPADATRSANSTELLLCTDCFCDGGPARAWQSVNEGKEAEADE